MSLSNIKIPAQLVVCLLVLGLAACTTSNQQSLGVGVTPTANSNPAPVDANTADANATDANATDANTQTALAPTNGTPTPAAAAALGVTSPNSTAGSEAQIARVGFLPITGAPQKAVTSLSRALGNVSKQHKVDIAGSGDTSVRYQMKGYMSALNEGPRTTVTFYWDVLDRSGKRLYRINGFEQENGAKANPWDGVSNATMQRIANRTMGSFAKWVKRKGA